MHHPTDRIAHTMSFITPVVELWLEQEIGQCVHREVTHTASKAWVAVLVKYVDSLRNALVLSVLAVLAGTGVLAPIVPRLTWLVDCSFVHAHTCN